MQDNAEIYARTTRPHPSNASALNPKQDPPPPNTQMMSSPHPPTHTRAPPRLIQTFGATKHRGASPTKDVLLLRNKPGSRKSDSLSTHLCHKSKSLRATLSHHSELGALGMLLKKKQKACQDLIFFALSLNKTGDEKYDRRLNQYLQVGAG